MIRRILLVIPTLMLAMTMIFALLRYLPADAAMLMLGAEGQPYSQEAADRLRDRLGLGRPLYVQYFDFWGNVLRGDLGDSLWTKQPVLDEISHRFPVTLELLVIALALGWVWGVTAGIISALKRDQLVDHVARSLSIAGLSVPIFWTGILLIVLPARWWGWTPLRHYEPLWENPVENLQLMILPAIVLALFLGAPVMRLARTTMLDVLRQDYIRTAHAKGLRTGKVVLRHAVRNSLIPVVTLMGVQVVVGLGGIVILETLFSIPGMGRLLIVEALPKRDYPMIQGINLVVAVTAATVNLAVDLSYGLLDPRIRYQ